MSDYMFLLENHLSAEQAAALAAVETTAAAAGLSLYLTGGALRDMLGGFPIRDLDFTVEGPALRLAASLVKKHGAKLLREDTHRRLAELELAGARLEIAMARTERYGKPGARPVVAACGIHDDLRGRDFTVNAMGLSLNRASRGLMIDPLNGAADVERRELHACSNYAFYDDPLRLLRFVRLRTRLGFAPGERTLAQYRNARESGVEASIPSEALLAELRQWAFEPNPLEVLKALEEEGLLKLYSPALGGAKLNAPMFQKLVKVKALIPYGAVFPIDHYGLFVWTLTALLTPKEKAALLKATRMLKPDRTPWEQLPARAKKLEHALKSARLTRASQVYDLLHAARGEEILLLDLHSPLRLVQDRIRNYFTKYMATALDVSDSEVAGTSGIAPGTPKFAKAKAARIAARLDGRARKPAPPPAPEPPPTPSPRGPMGRAARFR